MPLVFTYGPETQQGRMFDRIGPSNFVGTARLPGYRLVFDKPNMKNKKEGLANLSQDDDASTFGLIFELTGKQLTALDGYYGGYAQEEVHIRVPTEKGERRGKAIAWVARRTKPNLKPSFEMMEFCKRGMEENEAPDAYLEELENFEVLPAETTELIVTFEREFPEEDARSIVEQAGGKIRRRMRSDHADQVILLAKVPNKSLSSIEKLLNELESVQELERNQGGYQAI